MANLGLVETEEDYVAVTIEKETLPAAFGGRVRYCAKIASGWWTAYRDTPEAAARAVVNLYKKERARYGNK